MPHKKSKPVSKGGRKQKHYAIARHFQSDRLLLCIKGQWNPHVNSPQRAAFAGMPVFPGGNMEKSHGGDPLATLRSEIQEETRHHFALHEGESPKSELVAKIPIDKADLHYHYVEYREGDQRFDSQDRSSYEMSQVVEIPIGPFLTPKKEWSNQEIIKKVFSLIPGFDLGKVPEESKQEWSESSIPLMICHEIRQMQEIYWEILKDL